MFILIDHKNMKFKLLFPMVKKKWNIFQFWYCLTKLNLLNETKNILILLRVFFINLCKRFRVCLPIVEGSFRLPIGCSWCTQKCIKKPDIDTYKLKVSRPNDLTTIIKWISLFLYFDDFYSLNMLLYWHMSEKSLFV